MKTNPGFFVMVPLMVAIFVCQPDLANSENQAFPNISAPDQKGPYNVGITTFCARMNGGRITRVQVFYPTLEPANCESKYAVYRFPQVAPPPALIAPIPSLDACFSDEIFTLSTNLCAVPDAMPAPGKFSMVVDDHGGGVPGPDVSRLAQNPLLETMASHGIIGVHALHGAFSNGVPDLKLLIDTMLNPNTAPHTPNAILEGVLPSRIDSERIGVSGVSAGGQNSLFLVGGVPTANPPILPDPRIKAMVVYEPGFPNFDAAHVSIPYLVMAGTQNSGGLAVPNLFDATVNATPRIFVLNPGAVHKSYDSGHCPLGDGAREYALENDPLLRDSETDELLIEPLTHYDEVIRACKSGVGPAAQTACTSWHFARRPQFCAPSNPATFGFGSGRNFCDRTGVNSIESLDTDGDGFTDPTDPLTGLVLYSPTDECTAEEPINGETMVYLMRLYTVSFWKKFLDGDGRYMRYLTPGYAKVHNLQAEVEIRE